MSYVAPSHRQLSKSLPAAMSPSRISDIAKSSPCLKEMDASIEKCKVTKIRPAKDGALELEYRCKFVKSGTGDKFTARILGKLYQDEKGEREYKALLESSKEDEAPLGADASLKGFALYVPELRLLLRSPSTDRKLHGLRLALDPEAMKRFLGDFLDASNGGRESVRKCEIDILRYKPEKRCTLRYRLEAVDLLSHRTLERSFVGKMYDDGEEGERVFTVMQELYGKGFGGGSSGSIKVPRPLGYIGELHMVLMENVPGSSLTKSFSSPNLADNLEVAARALAEIHDCPVKTARERGVRGEVSGLKRWVWKATQVYPELAESLEASLKGILESANDLRCHKPVLVHGDFSPNQVLLGSDGATIVDFDSICNGDPAIDVGNFLAHLKWKELELSWTEEEARNYGEAFLATYQPHIQPELRTRVGFYYRATLLRLACLLSLRPERHYLTAPLLVEAGKVYHF